jgi:hypothetical protein
MAMLNAASEPKHMEIYEGGHEVNVEKARTDRHTFLREHLSV